MRRRPFLAMVGVAAVAGCLGAEEDPENEPADEDPAADTSDEQPSEDDQEEDEVEDDAEASEDDDTEEDGSASFELVGIEAPDQVGVGDSFDVEIVIENVGGEDGVFESPLSVKLGDHDWERADEIQIEVPAGETTTEVLEDASSPYMMEIGYRIDEFGDEGEFFVDVGAATRTFGETWEHSTEEWEFTVEGVEFQDYYEYEDYDGEMATEHAEDGQQFAFVQAHGVNNSDGEERLPRSNDIVILVDTEQYDSVRIRREEGEYEGGFVQPDVERDGWIVFDLPAGVDAEDLEVVHSGSDIIGEWRISWTA